MQKTSTVYINTSEPVIPRFVHRGYVTVIGGRKYHNREQEPFVTIIMDFELAAELYSRDFVNLDFGNHKIELGAAI